MVVEKVIRVPGGKDEGVTLKGFLVSNSPEIDQVRKHPAVLILPGGAYRLVSNRESEPIAYKFIAEGIQAFVLNYTVKPYGEYPMAQCEALLAIGYIREHADEFNIDVNNISVCGFSAGGHLAASIGAFWNDIDMKEVIGDRGETVKPNKVILSYPVITSGEKAHKESIENLLGSQVSNKSLWDKMSLEKQVTRQYPPVFIWHTMNDSVVPVENSLLFVNALINNGVYTEFHLYPNGKHGLSLGNYLSDGDIPYGINHSTSEWIDKAISFIYS